MSGSARQICLGWILRLYLPLMPGTFCENFMWFRMVSCVSSGIEFQWLQQCHHIHNDMFFVCAAILFQSPLLLFTCAVATQALFVAMMGGWAECLEVGNPEPTDEAPALRLVNHLWWQLLSPYLITAGNVISTYYAEDPEVYFKKQRNNRHLEFHELGYPQNWGTASPAFAMALVCPQLHYLSHMWGIGFSKFGCGVPQHLSVGSSQRPLWSHWRRRFASWSIQDGSCSSQWAWKRSRVWKSCWRSVKHSWIDWGVHDWLQGSKGTSPVTHLSPVTCPQSTSWSWLRGLVSKESGRGDYDRIDIGPMDFESWPEHQWIYLGALASGRGDYDGIDIEPMDFERWPDRRRTHGLRIYLEPMAMTSEPWDGWNATSERWSWWQATSKSHDRWLRQVINI